MKPAYLLAGVALGPYCLGALGKKAPWLSAFAINVEAIDKLAAFGVVALLFTMGLELSFERLRLMHRLVFGLGLGQVVLTTLALGAVAWALGLLAPSGSTERMLFLSRRLRRAPLIQPNSSKFCMSGWTVVACFRHRPARARRAPRPLGPRASAPSSTRRSRRAAS